MQPSPQFTPHQSSPSGQGSSVWIFVGCGLLLLLMLCAGSGGLIYYAMQQGAAVAGGGASPGMPGVDPGAPGTGPAPAPGPAPVPMNPRTVQATITQVMGSSPAPVNATCNFIVSTWSDASSATGVTCRAQVVCGGQLLYGGPTAGYFPCTVADQPPSVVGRDEQTTSADSDAAMTIDSNQRTLTVHDDASGPYGAYSVSARVDSVL